MTASSDPTAGLENAATSSNAPWSLKLLGAFGVVALVVVLARATPLAALLDRDALARLGHAVSASPAAPAIVVGVYVAAGLVLFPVTPLLAATALVFPPASALALGLAGALASAAVGHAAGRIVARRRPRWADGPRLAPLRARLQRRGVLALATTRLLPVGNFTLANVAAGAFAIPFRDFILGNALGLLVQLAMLTGLARALLGHGWLA